MLTWFKDRAPMRLKLVALCASQAAIVAGTAASCIAYHDATATLCMIGAGGIALSLLLGLILSNMIVVPYVASLVRLEKLAAGDLETPIEYIEKVDCVGRMAKAMNIFRQSLLEKARDEQVAGEARQRTDGDHEAREREKAALAEKLALVMAALAEGLGKLALGDLVYRIDQPFTPDTEKLRHDFNASLQQLQDTMSSVGSAVQAIRSGSQEISTAADDLSRRTEQQAASLEETASALNHITTTVKKTAEAASHARGVVSTAKSDAEKSGNIVRRAIEAMGGIENSSRQISQIIGVIDEIAFQTNLLALNAGVEAARAGDAGRGFAVVASEVRGLAQRSAEAAKEIKSLISASEVHVSQGVELVGEAGTALGRIVEHVAQINTIVIEIASSAQEQATGLNEVNTAVSQMDAVTQQNAAMVEESTAASHTLSQESGELALMIDRFKVGRQASVVQKVARRAPKAAPPRPVPALKTVSSWGGSAAVQKKEPAHSADSWEEF